MCFTGTAHPCPPAPTSTGITKGKPSFSMLLYSKQEQRRVKAKSLHWGFSLDMYISCFG